MSNTGFKGSYIMHPDIVGNIDQFLASDMIYLNPLGKTKCRVTFSEEEGGIEHLRKGL